MNKKILRIFSIISILCLPNLLTACDQNKVTATPAEKPANFAQPQMDAYKKAQDVQNVMDKAEAKKKDEMQAEGL